MFLMKLLEEDFLATLNWTANQGHQLFLTADEEKRLMKYILDMGEMGFGLTHDDLQIVAYKMAEKVRRPQPFQSEKAGRSWLNSFFF